MGTIQYQDAGFYTSYFKRVEGFSLVDEFRESAEENEKDLYIGMIEAVGSIHQLRIRVEIPKSFPYAKLTFRTKSLKGYPHLIFNGKTKYGSWFCLNTPFAETAEEQLNQEVTRLNEWIHRQMRSDLPAIIEDSNVVNALRFANAYDWENVDEMNEFSREASLIFVGDFHKNKSNFKESKGHLYCVKTTDDRYYALETSSAANAKLPYVIVEKIPTEEALQDFLKLSEFYKWDDEMIKHLLPDISFDRSWHIPQVTITYRTMSFFEAFHGIEESVALKSIDEVLAELGKENSYLPGHYDAQVEDYGSIPTLQPIRIPNSLKPALSKEMDKLRNNTIANHEYAPQKHSDPDWEDYLCDCNRESALFRFFAIAFTNEDGDLSWHMILSNQDMAQNERYTFDVKLKSISFERLLGQGIICLDSQYITRQMFFGRGSFSPVFSKKKIALVGLGAIGSMVAESLCRSGVSVIGLWDTDIVEPGNICRSAYTLSDMGESKVLATKKRLLSINPFISAKEIHCGGKWIYDWDHPNRIEFVGGSFYGNVNYSSQEDVIKEIKNYDLIIDCTASNEMLHFLSYAVPEKQIISLCITNHASNLLCITNRDGNPFELRKAYLSRIEQDTKNFYLEGSGCYSPTFLATHSDISALVCMTLKELNLSMMEGSLMHSCILSYDRRGILKDTIQSYHLQGYDITMSICSESILDAEDIAEEATKHTIGHVLGAYSADRKSIMITHVVDPASAESRLLDVFETSHGIIDYIGDYAFSEADSNIYSEESFLQIESKAADNSINTCNPILAVYNTGKTIDFYLFINGEMVPFIKDEN